MKVKLMQTKKASSCRQPLHAYFSNFPRNYFGCIQFVRELQLRSASYLTDNGNEKPFVSSYVRFSFHSKMRESL